MSETINAKVPLDFQLEHERLQQKQAIANALMQRAMSPNVGQMVGPHYAAPSGIAAIGAPIAQALMANKMNADNDERSRALSALYAGIGAGDEKFGHTPVKMRGPDGQLADVLIGDRGSVKPITTMGPAEEQAATAGGQLYGKYSGKPGSWLGEDFGPTQIVNGEAVQFDRRSGKAHQVANRPAQVHATAVNKGEDAFMASLGKDTAAMVTDARQKKQAGQATLDVVQRLENLDKQGLSSGIAAPAATFMGNLAQSLGISVDAAKLGRDQAYDSVLGQQVSKVLLSGSVGRSMTDEDRKAYMTQFAQRMNTPEGRAQIYRELRQSAGHDIGYADQVQRNLTKNFPEAGRLFELAPSNLPYPPQGGQQAPQGGKPSTSNW